MKLFRNIFFAAALLTGLSACNRAVVSGEFGAAPSSGVVLVKTLAGEQLQTVDTLHLDGVHFKYGMKMEKGQPEFVYLYCGDVKVASLLLAAGDRVQVQCDTTGRWTVEGSDDCRKLLDNEMAYADLFKNGYVNGRQYVEYYRKMVQYVLSNSHSLTVIPVLYSKVGDVPVFAQVTDAVLFNNVADSLETVYPESKYVKQLRVEADKRRDRLQLQGLVDRAVSLIYPDLSYPGIDGQKVSLKESATGKATLLVFWDATDGLNKVYNLEVLKPLYERCSPDGLQIYAVNLGADKKTWATVVREQKLPWVNVCDATGTSLSLYNVDSLPTAILITADGVEKLSSLELAYLQSRVTASLKR